MPNAAASLHLEIEDEMLDDKVVKVWGVGVGGTTFFCHMGEKMKRKKKIIHPHTLEVHNG